MSTFYIITPPDPNYGRARSIFRPCHVGIQESWRRDFGGSVTMVRAASNATHLIPTRTRFRPAGRTRFGGRDRLYCIPWMRREPQSRWRLGEMSRLSR